MRNYIQFTYKLLFWQKYWQFIEININDKLKHELENKYKDLDKKLDGFIIQQRKEQEVEHNSKFYKRVMNLSDTEFNESEIKL